MKFFLLISDPAACTSLKEIELRLFVLFSTLQCRNFGRELVSCWETNWPKIFDLIHDSANRAWRHGFRVPTFFLFFFFLLLIRSSKGILFFPCLVTYVHLDHCPCDSCSQMFAGNSDRHFVVYHRFPKIVSAEFARFHPRTWQSWISARIEFFGCPGEVASASNERQDNQAPLKTRLYLAQLSYRYLFVYVLYLVFGGLVSSWY